MQRPPNYAEGEGDPFMIFVNTISLTFFQVYLNWLGWAFPWEGKPLSAVFELIKCVIIRGIYIICDNMKRWENIKLGTGTLYSKIPIEG